MKKVSVIALFLILALCLTGAASAAPKYKLLFGHTLTENDAFHKGMVAWAEAVAKDTNGEKEKASLREIGSNLKTSGWALAFPFLLLFGLRLGIFTTSECGAFACMYALFVGVFIYRKLNWRVFVETMRRAILDNGGIMLAFPQFVMFIPNLIFG